MARQGQLIALLIGVFLLLTVSFAAPVIADEHTQTNSSEGQWVQWTPNQTIDSGVTDASLSHVDGDGQMHIGYLTDSGVQYAAVSLMGTVTAQTQVQSAVGTISQLHTTSPAPGVAHIVWKQQNSVTGGPAIQYAVVTNGSFTTSRTLVSVSNPDIELTLQDAEADTYGRTHVLFERVQTDATVGGSSATSAGSMENHVLAVNGTQVQSVTVAENDVSTESWGVAAAELALKPNRVTVTFARDYGKYTVDGSLVRSGDLATTLEVHHYRNSPPGLTALGTQTIASLSSDRVGTTESEVGAAAMHPEGYLVASVKSTAERDYYDETVILLDEQRGVLNPRFIDGAIRDPLWDDDGSLYARSGDSYTVRDTDGELIRQAGTLSGFQDWALNAEGYPSMIRVVDGELRYKAKVTQTAKQYPSVYDRAESGTQAQDEVIADLESRVATLQEQLNESSVTISVTVQPQGEAYIEGGEASVKIRAPDAEMENVAVRSAGETFRPDESGEVMIPLSTAGTQELTVQYRGQSVTKELQVTASDTATSSSASASGGTTLQNVLIPVFALITFVAIVQRRTSD